ncbi:MAG: AAA family ATPase [Chitinophagales bacterium]
MTSLATDIHHIHNLLQLSTRKMWRLGDLKYWNTFKASGLVTLSWMDAETDYQRISPSSLKRGKRVIPKWVNELNREDLMVLMDKTHYYGLGIAATDYHVSNPKLKLGNNKPSPAIRMQFVHALDKPVLHHFNISATNPDTFALANQLGFTLEQILQFLAANYPHTIEELAEVLDSDYQKSIEHQIHIAPEHFEEIRDKYPNPNILLYGPPGTGKTYHCIDMAAEIIGKSNPQHEVNQAIFQGALGNQIEMISFHPNYAYEDFIQGLRPVTNRNKGLEFELKDGIFKRIADRAILNYLASKVQLSRKDQQLLQYLQETNSIGQTNSNAYHHFSVNEEQAVYERQLKEGKRVDRQNYVLVIDEINRAHISSVFGELITLIEKDKRYDARNALSLRLPSGQPFVVAPNLYIIGTMNTTDKSIALLDMALRRRFDFKAVYPRYDLPQLAYADVLQKMNRKITQLRGREFQIGHAYFLKDRMGNFDLTYHLQYKIIPLLYEYFRNDEQAVKSVLDAANLHYVIGESGLIEVK